MNHQQTQTRPLLDAIVADTTAPQALRDDLRQALAMFDTSVDLDRHTEAMRRTWAAIHAGEVVTVDSKPGRITIRITAYWPDLLPE